VIGVLGDLDRIASVRHNTTPSDKSQAQDRRVNPELLGKPAYRERNRIERLFANTKEFCRIATRYDKRTRMFLGWLHLLFGFIRLRTKTNVNRT